MRVRKGGGSRNLTPYATSALVSLLFSLWLLLHVPNLQELYCILLFLWALENNQFQSQVSNEASH